tara:strand:- start:303 stop:452 length:150 start_codon:yes stop_codon:yes gene_type:complete
MPQVIFQYMLGEANDDSRMDLFGLSFIWLCFFNINNSLSVDLGRGKAAK